MVKVFAAGIVNGTFSDCINSLGWTNFPPQTNPKWRVENDSFIQLKKVSSRRVSTIPHLGEKYFGV
jgi:hypothetical protein